ncbi:MAG: hypothetical protein H6742_11550 [Alphaproteobacteria bacterium]|nr:hypothetical protein [Alphaproteobacteria bacterium]
MARRRPLALATLLRTGRWGHLRPGVSRQVLVAHLGQPDRWQRSLAEDRAEQAGLSIAGWALSEVLFFGGMEFHFPEDPAAGCFMFFCDDLDRLAAPFERGWLAEGLPTAQVTAQLDRMGLSWTIEPFSRAEGQRRVVLDHGVRLGVVDDPAFFGGEGEGERLFCVEIG